MAGRVPHPSPTRLPARRCRVCVFFFFSQIHTDSARFAPTRLDSRRIGFDSRRTGMIRPESVCIGHIGRRPIWPIWPKQAEIGLENRRRGRNSDLRCVSFLILSLFCESSILICFLRIF